MWAKYVVNRYYDSRVDTRQKSINIRLFWFSSFDTVFVICVIISTSY